MKRMTTVTIELESAKVEFLEDMVRQYSLTDTGKAVRCLVNFARANAAQHAEIFEEIRCLDC
jgi:hypothetical protein